MNRPFKHITLKRCGILIFGLSVIFLIHRFWENRQLLCNWQPTWYEISVLLLISIAYGGGMSLLPLAWFRSLRFFGIKRILLKDCYHAYAKTQIAKYIPGNIFHFAGRHIVGRNLGFDDRSLTKAMAFEITGLVIASSSVAFLGIWWGIDAKKGTLFADSYYLMVLCILVTTLLGSIYMIRLRFVKKDKREADRGGTREIWDFIIIYILYLLFFIIVGGLFAFTVYVFVSPLSFMNIGPIVTIFSISWISGFIVPGAPGGLGVREAVIVGALSNFLPESKSLLISILFRITTIVGDIFFFLSSFLIDNRTLSNLLHNARCKSKT